MSIVGFIGLGIMGKPMAMNLLKAGVKLLVNDIDQKTVDCLVTEGATQSQLSELGTNCEVIFTNLPSGSIVHNVLFGENGLAQTIKKGAVVCDLSSVTPMESQTCYKKLKELGVAFLDAPVSGGEPKAIDGTLAFMVGGDQTTFDIMEKYFDILGSSALLIGGPGSGSVTKLANQIIVNLTIATISEAFVLASKAGADPQKVYQAIRGGLAGSTVLDAKIPLILQRNFKPGGSLTVNLKDIKNVMQMAHTVDVPLPFTSQLLEVMQALKVSGHIEEDHGGIVQYFENLAGVEVKPNVGGLSR